MRTRGCDNQYQDASSLLEEVSNPTACGTYFEIGKSHAGGGVITIWSYAMLCSLPWKIMEFA